MARIQSIVICHDRRYSVNPPPQRIIGNNNAMIYYHIKLIGRAAYTMHSFCKNSLVSFFARVSENVKNETCSIQKLRYLPIRIIII